MIQEALLKPRREAEKAESLAPAPPKLDLSKGASEFIEKDRKVKMHFPRFRVFPAGGAATGGEI